MTTYAPEIARYLYVNIRWRHGLSVDALDATKHEHPCAIGTEASTAVVIWCVISQLEKMHCIWSVTFPNNECDWRGFFPEKSITAMMILTSTKDGRKNRKNLRNRVGSGSVDCDGNSSSSSFSCCFCSCGDTRYCCYQGISPCIFRGDDLHLDQPSTPDKNARFNSRVKIFQLRHAERTGVVLLRIPQERTRDVSENYWERGLLLKMFSSSFVLCSVCLNEWKRGEQMLVNVNDALTGESLMTCHWLKTCCFEQEFYPQGKKFWQHASKHSLPLRSPKRTN